MFHRPRHLCVPTGNPVLAGRLVGFSPLLHHLQLSDMPVRGLGSLKFRARRPAYSSERVTANCLFTGGPHDQRCEFVR